MAGHEAFVKEYFKSQPSEWSWTDFKTRFLAFDTTACHGEAGSRFLNNLEKLRANSNTSGERKKRAQTLINSCKNRASRAKRKSRLTNPPQVIYASGGHIINTAGGSVTVNRIGAEEAEVMVVVEENGDNGGDSPHSLPVQSFHLAHSKMQDANKKTFASGRVLEDVIHSSVLLDPSDIVSNTLEWILDPEDRAFNHWLTPAEVEEFHTWAPATPTLDSSYVFARERYKDKTTLLSLWETAQSKPTPQGTHCNRGCNYNATYVNLAVGSMLSMIEQSATNESFGSPHCHREGWFGSQLWGVLLDRCMDDINDFTVSRTEILSRAGNSKHRFDAILLAGGVGVEPAEVGAVEVARAPGVVAAGKRLNDEHKLRTVMKAMLRELWKLVDYNAEAGRTLQVVGLQHLGFKVRISTMYAPSEGVYVLSPGTWRSVPQKLENFEKVFAVMESLVIMKAIVGRTVGTLRAYVSEKNVGQGI